MMIDVIQCKECQNFRRFGEGQLASRSVYGECRCRKYSECVVKETDYCSYAVPSNPAKRGREIFRKEPLPDYDDHDVSGLVDE